MIVFNDVDRDGAYDTNEPATSTGFDDSYAFVGIWDGLQAIQAHLPEGVSAPNGGAAFVRVRGRGVKAKPIGLRPMGAISGTVFADAASDGTRSPDDQPLRGVRLFLDTNGDGVWQKKTEPSARSDRNGQYAFPGLTAGSYQVRLEHGKKRVVTTPLVEPLVITPGTWGVGRDFGLVQDRIG